MIRHPARCISWASSLERKTFQIFIAAGMSVYNEKSGDNTAEKSFRCGT